MSVIPLRAKYPEIHERLTKELEARGVHIFEVKADIIHDNNNEVEKLSIKFGDQFAQECVMNLNGSQRLSDPEVSEFLMKTAEACQAQAVEDYHGFMNIQPVKPRF
ncbi:MAG TPA: hypothetical protein VFK37_10055 [Bacillales bacterium]|nr:hypothetical protein [Bacillales bacterium]